MDAYLKALVAGFAGGVFMASVFVVSGLGYFSLLMAAGLLVLGFFMEDKRFCFISAVFLFSFGSGVLRIVFSDTNIPEIPGAKMAIKGYISEEPDERENNTRVILKTKEFGRILIYAKKFPYYEYGDNLEIYGLLKKPEKFLDDKGNVFDWPAYLAKDGIYSETIYPKIQKTEGRSGGLVIRALFEIKKKFLTNLAALIPEPESALSAGISIGARRAIPKEVNDNFRQAGITHIVVLSGYNITIVADYIGRVASYLTSSVGFVLGVFGVVIFTLMTGASATAVRAALMAILLLVARKTGRLYAAPRALCAAGFLMLLQNPKLLVFDASFELSFLATLGLMILAEPIKKRLTFITESFNIREVIASTLSAQIFVLPLILHLTGIISIVSLITNILVLTAVPTSMLFSSITGVLGMISLTLAAPFGWLSYFLAFYILKVAEFSNRVPYHAVHINRFPNWAMVIFYTIIIYFSFLLSQKDRQNKNI